MHPKESETQRLEAFCKQLVEAIDEFEHELRRCKDAMERAGGRSAEHERRMRKLLENRDMNIKELEKARQRIRELGK